MGLFGTALTIAVAVAIFCMLSGSRRFWIAWALSIVVYSAFLFNIAPRPVFCTAVLFTITLTLLLQAQRSGRVQLLYWLPLVFCSGRTFTSSSSTGSLPWHIRRHQPAAASGDLVAGYPSFLLTPTLPLAQVLAVLACCLLASCVGPYSFHLYQVVFAMPRRKLSIRY